jgi:ubiquitin thioesterase protein OTUB1
MGEKECGGRGYKHIRRLRRDGNCFYRAFLFQLFEHYALNMDKYKSNYDNVISIIEKSKDELVQHGGYDLIVIEDFYDIFLEKLKGLENLKKDHEECKEDLTYQ